LVSCGKIDVAAKDLLCLRMKYKKACLVTLSKDTKESIQLARTLDIQIESTIFQNRISPDSRFYLGKGKIEELKELIDTQEFDVVLVNGDVTPSQHLRMEQYLNATVWDRTFLILNIFGKRARSKEAKIQVELARISHELPFLKEWVHHAKHGERPGFLAGGGYKVDQYFELAKRKQKTLRRKLMEIEKRRGVTRIHRESVFSIGLAGYTNAGKSSLHRILTGSSAKSDEMVFSTLEPLVKKVNDIYSDVIVIDTVGFIKDLPPSLERSFQSTFEGIFISDVVIFVVDASEDIIIIKEKIQSVHRVLRSGLDEGIKMLMILNKVDLVDLNELKRKTKAIKSFTSGYRILPVSCTSLVGIERVFEFIYQNSLSETYTIIIEPGEKERFMDRLNRYGIIQNIDWDQQVYVDIKFKKKYEEEALAYISSNGGKINNETRNQTCTKRT